MGTNGKTLTPMRRRALDQLLVHYLELPEREQPEWLDDTLTRFPRLGSWLSRLVEDSHTVTLLDDSMRRQARESVAKIEFEAQCLEPGDRVGPWQVQSEIGAGGMGRVYQGQRADGAFEMDVAIKQIGQRRRGLADLLQRECRLLARLDHSSITRLVDAGLDPRAGPFLVMEWVDGVDLKEWISREKPDLTARLVLFEQIAEAVSHAHERLIAHGDIKPENIRLRHDGAVKLLDFGVARLMESGEFDPASIRAFTPAFAAPEQREGWDITPASDIWSLGALLHWLVADARLDPTNSDNQPVARLAVPRSSELMAIIRKATAEQPQQRYRSVLELIQDLEHYRANQVVAALPPSFPRRLVKFAARHRFGVGVSLLLVASLVTAAAVSTVMAIQADQARQQAEASAETSRLIMETQQGLLSDMDPAMLANGMVVGLRQAIRENGGDERQLATFNAIAESADLTGLMQNVLVEQVIEPTEQHTLAMLDSEPADQAALRDSLGQVFMRWSLYERAADQFRLSSEVFDGLGPEHEAAYFSARTRLFSALARSGAFAEAMAIAEDVITRTRSDLGPNHEVTMEAEHAKASLFLVSRNLEAGIELLEPLVERRRAVLGLHHADTLASMHNLATAHLMAARFDLGHELLEPVVAGRREVLGPSHPATLSSTSNLATLLVELGLLDDGLELLGEVRRQQAETLGRQHSSYLLNTSNKAMVLRRAGRTDEALVIENQLVETYRETLGETHLETLRVRLNRATTRRETGDIERALDEFIEVARLRGSVLGPTHTSTLSAKVYVAHARWQLGQTVEAAEQMRSIGRQLDEHAGSSDPEAISAQLFLAEMLAELGRRDEAAAKIADRLQMVEDAGVPDSHPDHHQLITLLAELTDG